MHTENCKYFTLSQFCNSEHTFLSDISLFVFSNVNFICSAVGRGQRPTGINCEACLLSCCGLNFSENLCASYLLC